MRTVTQILDDFAAENARHSLTHTKLRLELRETLDIPPMHRTPPTGAAHPDNPEPPVNDLLQVEDLAD